MPKLPFSSSAITHFGKEPTCNSQVAKDDHWHHAMAEEYNALIQNGTWEFIPPLPFQNVIGYCWVLKTKMKSGESLDRYNACLVAKGMTSLD